jgi:hypothetical protein
MTGRALCSRQHHERVRHVPGLDLAPEQVASM